MSDKYDEDMERARALLACDRPAESENEAVEARVHARVLQAIRDGAPYNVDAMNQLRDRPAETPAEALLRQIRGWDMLDATANGPFWKQKIDDVLARSDHPSVSSSTDPRDGDRGSS